MNVADRAAALAAQVVMGVACVGIVALGPALGGDLENLAEPREAAKDVVDGRAADLGETRRRPFMNLVGREMHVIALEDLGDDAALGGQRPAAAPQAREQWFRPARRS